MNIPVTDPGRDVVDKAARLGWKAILVIVCVAMTIVAFRLVGTDEKRSAVWNPDEAVSACIANSINEHGLPYRDAVDHRGPLTYYIYAAVFSLAGRNNMVAIHGSLAILVVGVAFLVLAIGWVCCGKSVGIAAIVVFTLLSCAGAEGIDLMAFHTEWPLLACTTLAMFLLIVGLRNRRRVLLFTSGLFFGLAFLSKQVAAPDLGAAIIYVAIAGFAVRALWYQTVKSIATLIFGAMVPIAGCVGWFAANHALTDFWFYFWTYNTQYYMRSVTLAAQIRGLSDMWIYLSDHGMLPVVVLAFVGIVFAAKNLVASLRRTESRAPREIILICGWLASSWLGASISTRGFGHYYIASFSALSLLAGFAFLRILEITRHILNNLVQSGVTGRSSQGRLGSIVAGVLICSAIVLAGILVIFSFSTTGGGWGNPYRAVSRFIAESSAPEDTIFVWGFVPEIYVQSNRMHASRYVTCNQVTGLIIWENVLDPDTSSTAVPGAEKIMMDELRKNRPVFIVDTSIGNVWAYGKYPISKYPELSAFVDTSYREVGVHIDPDGKLRLRLLRRVD